MLSLMMKFAGGTLFQRNQLDPQEFIKQADMYEAVDANLLDRIYKMLLVAPVNHPLTIVRAREIMNWSDSHEYKDVLEGRYTRARSQNDNRSQGNKNGSTSSTNTGTGSGTNTGSGLVRCPHCGKEHPNRRFCSLCGGAIS